MNARTAMFAVCVSLAAAPYPAAAQTPEGAAGSRTANVPAITLYELALRDGSRLYGTVARQNDVEVVFKTQTGATVTAQLVEIASLKPVTGSLLQGEFVPQDPNATRLFFGPTARSLKRGQTYLGVYEFLMPFVQVGVTDRLSIGGGTPLMFGVDEWERPFWITPKLQVLDRPSGQIAVGVLHAFDVDGDGGGIGYVVGTSGSPAASVSIGAGMAYGTDGGRAGVVMVGGERTVRRNLKLITENYIWKGGNGVASAGVRFFGERVSADLALGFPIGADAFFAFPVVNFVYLF
jgi:hypothetical protein